MNSTTLAEFQNSIAEKVFFEDEQGNRIKDKDGSEVECDVNFWTGGAVKNIKEYLPIVDKNNPNAIEFLKKKYKNLVDLALQKGFASEERVIISESIINELLSQGYSLRKLANGDPAHHYIAEDMRNAVYADLYNGAGFEIRLLISPINAGTENEIEIQLRQKAYNESELMRYENNYKTILAETGYKLDKFTVV